MTISTLGPIKMPDSVTAASAKLKEITGEAAQAAPSAKKPVLPFGAPLSKDAFQSKLKEIGDKAMKETIAENKKTATERALEKAIESKKGFKDTVAGIFNSVVQAAKAHKVIAAAIAAVAAAGIGFGVYKGVQAKKAAQGETPAQEEKVAEEAVETK